MTKEKYFNHSKEKIYKVCAIGGKIKFRKELQKKIDDIENYARKHKLELKIEWEE